MCWHLPHQAASAESGAPHCAQACELSMPHLSLPMLERGQSMRAQYSFANGLLARPPRKACVRVHAQDQVRRGFSSTI
jgi:hypothetical protein